MPLYEFGCPECTFTKDVLIMSRETLVSAGTCPWCNAKLCRNMSTPSVIKINGFSEANGYAKKGNND